MKRVFHSSKRCAITAIAILVVTSVALAGRAQEPSEPLPEYSVLYEVGLVPSEKSAHVTIRLWADSKPIKWIRFKIDPNRYRA